VDWLALPLTLKDTKKEQVKFGMELDENRTAEQLEGVINQDSEATNWKIQGGMRGMLQMSNGDFRTCQVMVMRLDDDIASHTHAY